jgi:hypothetical protein
VVIYRRAPVAWVDLTLYPLLIVLLAVAAFILCLILARLLFPLYWWLGQVQGKDVFEYDGVYFMGLRIARVKSRVQRMVFGMDDRMHRWDLIFGLAFLVIMAPHVLAVASVSRLYDRVLPDPPKFSQTLHQALLSSLPIMRHWETTWSPDPLLLKRVTREVDLLRLQPRKTNAQRFLLAQLYLVKAFTLRERPTDPFVFSPGEAIFFDRGTGAQAVEYVNQLLAQPELERAGWSGGAMALKGFFYISDHNYLEAYSTLTAAQSELGQRDESGISRYLVLLLEAQAAILSGRPQQGIDQVGMVIGNDRLPKQAYALAFELYAEALRLTGRPGQVPDLMQKAMDLYQAERDQAGVARVHLHLAALALDQGRLIDASRELSTASRLAYGVRDAFTLNMVEKLTQAFPG